MKDLFGSSEQTRIAICGSTGSIGKQALDVVRRFPDRFEIVALTAGTDALTLMEQAREFGPQILGLREGQLPDVDARSFVGEDAAATVARECDASVILNAVVGAAGLSTTMETILSGKTLALANKESLVAGGEAVMAKAGPQQIRPVDSEHSAIWQLLDRLDPAGVRKMILTASGGPFRGWTRAQLEGVTVEQALAHPVWRMGDKITVDSATLMNKGLEVIEAHYLFGFTYDEIEVLVHPQSIIHGMVESVDGAVYAHAAKPDMRLPIEVALAWPERLSPPMVERIEWSALSALTFEPPDAEAFPCLPLAVEAGRRGDSYPAALNAANEVAVRAFLAGALSFVDIPVVIEKVMERHEPVPPTIDAVLEVDAWARDLASSIVKESA
ncbi:MAG TPA: 1-deoxy-D-xylulose-5-phosphate reductoisomerase [Actinomycetota bacterium]|nr:1-deoxy-D-xylulose-5-phosphate reductoisomerase [Actinomycetota bacterium]